LGTWAFMGVCAFGGDQWPRSPAWHQYISL